VRVVAAQARLHRIVEVRDDLRKAGRSRETVFVATQAGRSLTRYQRLGLDRVLRVSDGRSVAALAGQTAVVRKPLGLGFVFMTLGAGLEARVSNGDLSVHRDGGGPVVPQLAKRLRNEPLSEEQEGHDHQHEQEHDSNDRAR